MTKHKSHFTLILVGLCLLFSTTLVSSIVQAKEERQVAVNNSQAVMPETTKVLTTETTKYLTTISPDGQIYTFSEITPELAAVSAGDIVIGEQAGPAPYGFLRRVRSVLMENNQIVLETEAATLEEAFESLHISIDQTLTPAQIQRSVQRAGVALVEQQGEIFSIKIDNVVLYDADNDPATTFDQIRADGMVDLEIGYEFDMDIAGFTLERLTFLVDATETAELMIQTGTVTLSDIEVEIPIAEHTFAPIPVGIPGVVVVPKLTITVGIDGSVQANLTTGVTQQFTVSGGVTYDGEWNPILDYSNDFSYIPPQFMGTFSIQGYVDTALTILINGLVGPKFSVKPYLQLDADSNANPQWQLTGGLEVNVGVLVEIFSVTIVEYETNLLDYRLSLAGLWATYLPLVQVIQN